MNVSFGLKQSFNALQNQGRFNRLVEILQDWQGESFNLYALYPSRHLPPAKVSAFIDFVTEVLDLSEPAAHSYRARSKARVKAVTDVG
ncbi:hypothetical protein FBY04_11931 [Pseudomonas sp. SJZ080]|uniref:hypothetical protein n=1 Tax=Pseudomonas sp. SJZ080 TaxID=2572888 RepID=UPI00119C119C|nr:hypothetical protein [Pseudomonas sp. SJZ080]TWC50445.1 hypothetical protein FBY04_11931 [Pseudomonas sp. SJZ080]